MSALKYYSDLVQMMEEVYALLPSLNRGSSEVIDKWVQISAKNITTLNRHLQSSGLSVGKKLHIQSIIAALATLHEKFINHSVVGGSLQSTEQSIRWKDLENVFQNRIRTGVVINLQHLNLRDFLLDAEKLITRKLTEIVTSEENLKVNFVLACKFCNQTNKGKNIEIKYFNVKNEAILLATDIKRHFLGNVVDKLLSKVEDFQERDSGWSLVEIEYLQVNMNRYKPLSAGQSTFIPLPKFIQRKKAVLNIINDDECCFFRAVTAALYPAKTHSNKTSEYPHYKTVLKYKGINCPTTLHDVSKFEDLNNLTINVYGLDDNCEIIPLCLSKYYKVDNPCIHLLMVQSRVERDSKNHHNPVFHFCLIEDLSRLVRNQISKHNGRVILCDRCLNHFQVDTSFKKHQKDCINMNNTRISLPEKGVKIKFENFHFQETVPFAIYADLESILEPDNDGNQNHISCSVAYYLYCTYDDSKCRFDLKRGANCIDWFMIELKTIAETVKIYLENIVPMKPLTFQQSKDFQNSKICHICNKPFLQNETKVHDHCHFTGNYRGAAHVHCNLNFQNSHIIPVIFHNLSGYDSHFFIEALATSFEGRIELLPVNKEKFIKTVDQQIPYRKRKRDVVVKLRFIDSFRFMSNSIEKLASFLDNDAKVITQRFYSDPNEFKLVTRKGVFPYEYIDSWTKLDEQQLPDKSKFYLKLNDSDISDDDYRHARHVWDQFQFNTLGEYSDLYLKTDVLLLADIFQNFGQSCSSTYKLDPLHYYTAPGLAFDAILKYTEIELELLDNVEMLNFIEKGIRGGVAQCSNRYAKANNPYMCNDYNPNDDVSYLMYFDVNNLYGAAMSEHLPTGSFEWVEDDINISNIYNVITNIPCDSPIGYIFEVDLEYPQKLHEHHKNLPLCPEHRKPPNSNSS